MYLNKEEERIIYNATKLLSDMSYEGKIEPEQEDIVADLYELWLKSSYHSKRCRQTAKKFVQEKRKTDKTYAHTRKKG